MKKFLESDVWFLVFAGLATNAVILAAIGVAANHIGVLFLGTLCAIVSATYMLLFSRRKAERNKNNVQ